MKTPKKIIKTAFKTIPEANALFTVRMKLKSADSEIQNYVTALEAENLKFQKQIAKFQVENVSLNNRIKIYEENKKPELTPQQMAEIRESLKKYGLIFQSKPPKKQSFLK